MIYSRFDLHIVCDIIGLNFELHIVYDIVCDVAMIPLGEGGLNGQCSESFADSCSDCIFTGTMSMLLKQPDSIATPGSLIQPRPASPFPPLSGLPRHFF